MNEATTKPGNMPETGRPITIAVVGTHSTGKSTFLARLAHELRRDELEVATVADLGEQAQRIGLPILHNHTWASTLWIITRGISNELEAWAHADIVLVDRGVPDALGYYHAALAVRREDPDPPALRYLTSIVAQHSRHYDLILRTALEPGIPVGQGKSRDSGPDFRVLADRHIEDVLHRLGIVHESLPAAGHGAALARVIAFVGARMAASSDDHTPGSVSPTIAGAGFPSDHAASA